MCLQLVAAACRVLAELCGGGSWAGVDDHAAARARTEALQYAAPAALLAYLDAGKRCMHAAGPSQQPPAPTASLPPQASQLPPADSQQRRATPISQAKPSQLRRGKQQQPQPSSSHLADSKAQQDGMLYMASQVGQSATPLGTQQPASLAGAGGGVLPAVAVVGGAGAGATPSSVPLVLPEKLNKHKVGRACRTRPPSRKTRMHARSAG